MDTKDLNVRNEHSGQDNSGAGVAMYCIHLRHILVLGCLILGSSLAYSQQVEEAPRQGPVALEENQTAPRDGQASAPKRPFPVTIVATPEEEARARDREVKVDQHEADDLQAQRQAAEGAQRAAQSAERQEVSTLVLSLMSTVIALVAVGLSLWSALRAERTARTQLRAYVTIEATGVKPLGDGQPLICGVTVKNVGQTPATLDAIAIQVQVADISEDALPLFPDYEFHERWISLGGNGSPMTFESPALNASTVTPAMREALAAHKIAIRFFGQIRYRDVFGESHHTCFARILVGHGAKITDPLRADHLGHNSAN